MSQSFADLLALRKAEKNQLQNEIDQLYASANLPIVPKDDIQQSCRLERYMRKVAHTGKEIGWANREICTPYNAAKPQQDEARRKIEKFEEKNINPLKAKIKKINAELPALEEKASMPYLRDQLVSTLRNYHSLQKDDPTYRQTKIETQKSLYEQAQKIDELEKKYELYGNIPTLKPEIVTPDPIVQTTVDYQINNRPLLILGALGLMGLFLIWRLK